MAETTVDKDALLALLEPFPPEIVGKLPRITCPDCSRRRGACDEHPRQKCGACGAYTSAKHIHLDYVGHADVTRRLLEIDPEWQWDPIAEDDNGLPLFDTDDRGNPVGLWIKLTVLGVTRRGYGSCPSNQNDAVKVLIGDALRNAAMRFGVALDLWAKGDRADPAAENAVAAGGAAIRRRRPQHQAEPSSPPSDVTAEYRDLINVTSNRQEIVQTIRAARVAGADMAVVGRAAEERQKTLDARPTNKDGSTSRSRATDEQLAANGEMTKDQQREHNRLVREARQSPKPTERSTGPMQDDPWAAQGPGGNTQGSGSDAA